MKGLAGSNDLREVHRRADAGDADAAEALEVFCYRIRCTVGAYAAALGRLDAVVFTAGIGENDADVRGAGVRGPAACSGSRAGRGAQHRALPGRPGRSPRTAARVAVLVVPTNEELEIAEQALAVVRAPARANRRGRVRKRLGDVDRHRFRYDGRPRSPGRWGSAGPEAADVPLDGVRRLRGIARRPPRRRPPGARRAAGPPSRGQSSRARNASSSASRTAPRIARVMSATSRLSPASARPRGTRCRAR